MAHHKLPLCSPSSLSLPSLSVSAVTAFSVMLHYASCLPLLFCPHTPSPSEVTALLLVMTLSTDRSDIRRPRSTLPGNTAHPPSSRYTHNNPTAPMCLPRNASPPHPLSLVFSFHISSGHFVTDHRNGRGKHKLPYTHCRVSCLVYIDTKMLLTWTS